MLDCPPSAIARCGSGAPRYALLVGSELSCEEGALDTFEAGHRRKRVDAARARRSLTVDSLGEPQRGLAMDALEDIIGDMAWVKQNLMPQPKAARQVVIGLYVMCAYLVACASRALLDALARNEEFVAGFLRHPPQTN